MALREILAHFGFDFDGGKADEADKKIKKVKGSAEETTRGVVGLQNAFQALLAVGILRSVAGWVEGLADQGEALAQVSEATGLSTHDLQVWQFGAKKAGQDAEIFTIALRRLSAAAAGGADETGSQSKVFAKLGIQTKDATGHVKDLSVLLPEIAEHFKNTEDGAGKAALAQELFGRSGARLIPLLNQGADGIDNLKHEFDALGGGFSPEAIFQAQEFKIAIARVDTAFTSLSSQLAVSLLPHVADLLDDVTILVVNFKDFAASTTLLDDAFSTLAITIGVTLWGALAPFLVGALEFAAVYLAIDDLIGFMHGKDSEIGSILDGWFGDGSADAARDWVQDAEASLGNFIVDARAVWDVMSLDLNTFLDRLEARFLSAALAVDSTWNSIVDTLHLPKADFSFDTSAVRQSLDAKKHDIGADNYSRGLAEQRLEAYASAATPTGNNQQAIVGPLRGPSNATTWNTIENKQQITIQVPAGTPESQQRAIARQVRDVTREDHRAALQALENRAPAGG